MGEAQLRAVEWSWDRQASTWVALPTPCVQIQFSLPLSSECSLAKCMLWSTMSCCRFNVLYIESGSRDKGERVEVARRCRFNANESFYARFSFLWRIVQVYSPLGFSQGEGTFLNFWWIERFGRGASTARLKNGSQSVSRRRTIP